MSRKSFLKTAGAGAAAAGLAGAGIARASEIPGAAAPSTNSVQKDTSGSLIGAVRMDAGKSYSGVPEILAKFAKSGEADTESWEKIKAKIDYTYEIIHLALKEVVLQESLKKDLKEEIRAGKKLLFKPNIVNALVFDMSGFGGPGMGVLACTDWAFLAALMRWFHDKLGIDYTSMVVGEASTTIPSISAMVDGQFDILSGEQGGGDYDKFTPEALIEGRVPMPAQFPGFPFPNFYIGYPFYFVRKYLAESHDPAHTDDPMSGYYYSLTGNKAGADGMPSPDGNYIPPGKRQYLSVEDLNFSESPDRGRVVMVPDGGANFPEGVEFHKIVVGDPSDRSNYPGCVLINVPKLKVHDDTMITNAFKNIGIGMVPTGATNPDPENPYEFKYSLPHDFPATYKGLLPHTIWQVQFMEHPADHALLDEFYFLYGGMPDYSIPPRQTAGLAGTMVDTNLAVSRNFGASEGKSMVKHTLHVADCIITANVDHTGQMGPVGVSEGLALVSLDPVAMDSFCANYMSKNVPRAIANQYGLQFAMGVPIPRWSSSYQWISGMAEDGSPTYSYGAIVTDSGLDSPVMKNVELFYAQARGLGSMGYHIIGNDKTSTTNSSLISKDGHLGKAEHNAFVEIISPAMYFDYANILWWLQNTSVSYAAATDAIPGSQSSFAAEFMSYDSVQDGGNGDSFLDFSEKGKKGYYDTVLAVSSTGLNLGARPQDLFEHGFFFINSRFLKYSHPSWNVGGIDPVGTYLDGLAVSTALGLAYGGEQIDFFFRIPFGAGSDGIAKWPSLQFARYLTDMFLIYGTGGMYSYAVSGAAIISRAFGIPVSFRLYVPDSVPYAPGAPCNPYGLNFGANWARVMYPQGGIDSLRIVEINPGDPDYAKKVFTLELLGPDGNVLMNPQTGQEMRW